MDYETIAPGHVVVNLPKKSKKTRPDETGDIQPDFYRRWVYLINRDRIFDTITRNELTRQGFNGAHAHLLKSDEPADYFLESDQAIKVDGLIYLPGLHNNPIERDGARYWNLWCDPGLPLPGVVTEADVEPWLDHLAYLYPDPEEQTHIKNWFAFVLQRPDVKVNHALLLAGTSRVGKDMLLNPLRFGLGTENICEPPAGELRETFTDYLHHAKLVIFQEIQLFEGLNLENKLKPMLAAPPDMLRVRLFGRGFYETPNIVQAIFMSNYRDALHISEGDGRYFAVWTDVKPLSADYYNEFAGWLEHGGNAMVVRWLLDRDVGGFQPKKPAPDTKFKSELIVTSKSPLRHQLDDMIRAMDYPFTVDCVRSLDIAKVMRDKYSAKAIGQVLIEMGCLQRECRRATGKREKVSLYAVRNLDEWEARSMLKWLDEYDRRRSDYDVPSS